MDRTKLLITQQHHSNYYVNGRINDKSVSFLVDTGALKMAISGDMAKDL